MYVTLICLCVIIYLENAFANLSNSRNIVRYAQCIAVFGIAVDENFDGKYALSGRSDKAHAIGFTLHRAVNVPVQRCFNARVT